MTITERQAWQLASLAHDLLDDVLFEKDTWLEKQHPAYRPVISTWSALMALAEVLTPFSGPVEEG